MNMTSQEGKHVQTPQISAEMLNLYLYGRRQHDVTAANLPVGVFLPPQLRLQPSSIPFCAVGVFSTTWIRSGTLLGPVAGRPAMLPQQLSQQDEAVSWEIMTEEGSFSHHVILDMTSWPAYVVCARHHIEQNLILVQKDGRLFYEAKKLIRPGEELLVWYGPQYNLYLGLLDPHQPGSTSQTKDADVQDSELVVPESADSSTPRFRCVICRRAFNSRSNLRSHMRIHTMEKPFQCTFCDRMFSQSSTLRNHIRLHTGEKPYRCTACQSSYSQLAGLRAHQKSARHRHPSVTETAHTPRDTKVPREGTSGLIDTPSSNYRHTVKSKVDTSLEEDNIGVLHQNISFFRTNMRQSSFIE